jgi:DNA-binding NarL/FixJ family response regulator
MSRKKQQVENNGKTKILVVDDHPIVRRGLMELINHEKDLFVCGQAEDAPQAMKGIRTLNPHLVIVDITLKEKNGMELIKDIKVQYPDLPVLALSMPNGPCAPALRAIL